MPFLFQPPVGDVRAAPASRVFVFVLPAITAKWEKKYNYWRKMKKIFTAEQISDWFTSGNRFANIKLTEEVAERKSDDEPSSKESRYDGLVSVNVLDLKLSSMLAWSSFAFRC